MGSLASALGPIAAALTDAPRVYVDANVPNGAVVFMRQTLRWDVLFVLEVPDLRRAPDRDHFRRAVDLGRTLITLDHDFFDAARFPPSAGPGVIVCSAPDEQGLTRQLTHVDRVLLRGDDGVARSVRGRTIEITADVVPPPPRGRRGRRRSRARHARRVA